MEPIKPTATLTGKIRESADDGDAASGTIGSLPFHLTEKILGCISPLESVRFAAVCRSWAEIISERLARPTPHLFALEVLDEGLRGAIFSIPIDDGGEDSPAPVVPARLPSTVSDAKHFELCGVLPSGRISFAYKSSLVLVNPATGAVRGIQTYAHRIMYPTEPMFCSGAEAFFIGQSFGRNFSLWWCTEGEWSERKLLLPEDLKCADDIDLVAYSDGVFYAMQIFGSTYTIDTRAPMPWRLTRLSVPSIREQLGDRFIRNFHLLESEGEVMFVVRVLATQEPAYSNSFGGYEVYRLDVEGARWVKVERLAGDRALFVSGESSFAVRASETPGCMSNCIYFVVEVYECCYVTWGVYSMEERKVLFQRHVGGSPGKYDAARWFLPGVMVPLAHRGKKRKNPISSECQEEDGR
ncbi:uncharacterized protein LOC119340261 [Triticum dicoccoides]|uniref:uncharacterized protein LOC119340261 n=1 Tax=Triticum dicoccoides TaxID=85692 RepID=UPI00189159ED|nr:uncharacterized protein LOC119340261 [Triticum dicoccoides]XP_044432177.1 uncharacterized protein LOC123158128 [Triticum aestivum]